MALTVRVIAASTVQSFVFRRSLCLDIIDVRAADAFLVALCLRLASRCLDGTGAPDSIILALCRWRSRLVANLCQAQPRGLRTMARLR